MKLNDVVGNDSRGGGNVVGLRLGLDQRHERKISKSPGKR